MIRIIARQSLRVRARNRTGRWCRINRALIVSRGDRLVRGGPYGWRSFEKRTFSPVSETENMFAVENTAKSCENSGSYPFLRSTGAYFVCVTRRYEMSK